MTYIEKRLEEFDFRDVDRAIMDFQIHVRKVTGGNDSSCVDSTELKTAIIKSIIQSKQEEIEGEIEKMKKTQDEVDDNDEGERYYNEALDDLKPIISKILK